MWSLTCTPLKQQSIKLIGLIFHNNGLFCIISHRANLCNFRIVFHMMMCSKNDSVSLSKYRMISQLIEIKIRVVNVSKKTCDVLLRIISMINLNEILIDFVLFPFLTLLGLIFMLKCLSLLSKYFFFENFVWCNAFALVKLSCGGEVVGFFYVWFLLCYNLYI